MEGRARKTQASTSSLPSTGSKVDTNPTTHINTALEHWEKLQTLIKSEFSLLEETRKALEKEKLEFDAMKEKIATVHFSSTIKLDVGGHQFKTSLSTLRKEESMLSKMFSGKGFVVEKDEDGFYFIDRPGAYFAPILHYLQTGTFIPPNNRQKLKAIAKEADFYQIRSLINLLSVHTFAFSHLNDTNGILYWLGTQKDTSSYNNPLSLGLVKVSGSSSNPSNMVSTHQNSGDGGGCNSFLNKQITIDLAGLVVVPTSYSLSYSQNCCRPSNWKLEGSSDSTTWKILYNHQNEQALGTTNRANWVIKNQKEQAFSVFRLTCTGYDASGGGCSCFHVSGFEVYGIVKENFE